MHTQGQDVLAPCGQKGRQTEGLPTLHNSHFHLSFTFKTVLRGAWKGGSQHHCVPAA